MYWKMVINFASRVCNSFFELMLDLFVVSANCLCDECIYYELRVQ